MSLLKRMQKDLLAQCRDRVAERIARNSFDVSGEHFYTIAVILFGYHVSPISSQFYEDFLRARIFMGEAVRWATLKPPPGWLS